MPPKPKIFKKKRKRSAPKVQKQKKVPKVKPAPQPVIKHHQNALALAAWWEISKQKLYAGKEFIAKVHEAYVRRVKTYDVSEAPGLTRARLNSPTNACDSELAGLQVVAMVNRVRKVVLQTKCVWWYEKVGPDGKPPSGKQRECILKFVRNRSYDAVYESDSEEEEQEQEEEEEEEQEDDDEEDEEQEQEAPGLAAMADAAEEAPPATPGGNIEIHGCRLLVQVITRTSPKRRVISILQVITRNYFKITSEVLSGN